MVLLEKEAGKKCNIVRKRIPSAPAGIYAKNNYKNCIVLHLLSYLVYFYVSFCAF